MYIRNMIEWGFFLGGGFLLGSVMFSALIPRVFLHMDPASLSPDRNPGATNVFIHCGPVWGMICLSLDLLKGYLPVALALRVLDGDSLWFGAVMAAPVLGHALAPLHGGRGGKCIATAFGCLLGVFPMTRIVLLLVGIYIAFSTFLKISPNRIRSIAAFGLFGAAALLELIVRGKCSAALGCALISLTVIYRHSRHCAPEPVTSRTTQGT